jgi:hypothetical protein
VLIWKFQDDTRADMEVSEDTRADLEVSGRYQCQHGSFRKIPMLISKYQDDTRADMVNVM